MKKNLKLISILLSTSLVLTACNAQETASAIEDALNSMEEIQQSIEEFQVPESISNVDEENEDKEEEEVVEENQTYPTSFDLEKIYSSEEDFDADIEKAISLAEELAEKYRGKLNNKENIINYYQEYMNSGLTDCVSDVYQYAYLKYNLDFSDSDATRMLNKSFGLFDTVNNILAFEEEEIMQLPIEDRKEIFASPELERYQNAFYFFLDDESVVLNENENIIYNTLTSSDYAINSIYNILKTTETDNPIIVMPDGEEVELTDSVYSDIQHGDYSHDFYEEVYNAKLGKYNKNVNTFTALLEKYMSDNYAKATVKGYDTVLDYALSENSVEREIYTNNIESVNNMLSDVSRYVSLHNKSLGLDEGIKSSYIELFKNSSDYNEKIPYDDAVKKTEEALSVFGDDYVSVFDEILRNGNVDVYPKENKNTGGFQIASPDKELLPYILLNYNGTARDCGTLAHEGGHAMYSYYSVNNPDNGYFIEDPATFTQEITSTLNEFIMFKYLRDNAQTDEEKLFYIEEEIRLINQTCILQTLYSEFEKHCYDLVESGEGLDSEEISEYWAQLYMEYWGDDFEISENTKYGWIAIPHFYKMYYVYQYATSITYASIIYSKIENGDESIIEEYLNMLSQGKAYKPSELLKIVDIDPLDIDVYQNFAVFYKNLVDEYENTLIEMGRIEANKGE